MWPDRRALQAREQDESACVAHFALTRVTRIFQKRVFIKIAPAGDERNSPGFFMPARERRGGGLRTATLGCSERSSSQFHCNFSVFQQRRPPWLGEQR
jgi:hypothetical protein